MASGTEWFFEQSYIDKRAYAFLSITQYAHLRFSASRRLGRCIYGRKSIPSIKDERFFGYNLVALLSNGPAKSAIKTGHYAIFLNLRACRQLSDGHQFQRKRRLVGPALGPLIGHDNGGVFGYKTMVVLLLFDRSSPKDLSCPINHCLEPIMRASTIVWISL